MAFFLYKLTALIMVDGKDFLKNNFHYPSNSFVESLFLRQIKKYY
jgi:hypothetical protein